MGLAAPRKRTKIAHDPRNLAWTNEDSYGQRLMQSQGWKEGQALGARDRKYADTQAASLKVSIKDDTLGLGASLKSKDIANQRTGFDAFSSLLGRLNAKDAAELQAVEKKIEDKKLASFAQGRWGGMVFVPGGILVQRDPFKQNVEEDEKTASDVADQKDDATMLSPDDAAEEKAKRKAEKRQRKEERRLRKEQRLLKKARKSDADLGLPTPDSSSANEGETTSKKEKKSKKRQRSIEPEIMTPTVPVKVLPRNGRQLLRGKNILAKRAAFSDMKGLDEIFMRKS